MVNIKSVVLIGAVADARLTGEKTKTIKEYKECIQRARQDTAKLDASSVC